MTSGTNYRWVTVLVAGLMAGVIAAVVTPRFNDDGVDWLITIIAVLVVGAAVALLTREKTPSDGAHVRDDVLGPDR